MEPDVAGGGGGEPKHSGLGGRGRAGDYSCPGDPDPRRPPRASLDTLRYNRRTRGVLFLTLCVRGQSVCSASGNGVFMFLTWSLRTACGEDLCTVRSEPCGTVLCQENRVRVRLCARRCVCVCVCFSSVLYSCQASWRLFHT